tara:strand:- start:154 stop:1698 length:1545 start_codon:yes stop_codon:yes gene_type:complete
LKKESFTSYLFLIFLGSITSLSLPPFNYFIINFLTFSLIFIFLIKRSKVHQKKKLFFLYGWLFGFGYFASSLYWISISLTFDENFKFLIPLAIFIIPGFLSIFFGLISCMFIIFKSKKIINSFLIFSLIFGVLEFLRGSILTGFPWNLIAFSFSNQSEILSITSVIGTYGFNLVCVSLFTSPALFIIRYSKLEVGISIFFLITFVFFYSYGVYYKDEFSKEKKEIYDYKIRVIGSNISLDRFYSNIDTASIIEELVKISSPKLKEKTIFVWPEGILPGVYQEELSGYSSIFDKNFSENHLLIIGTNTQIENNVSKNFFNTLSIYDDKLNLLDSYNKINLVPFGEFLPFETILKKIGLKSLTNNYQPFSKGEKREIIDIKKKNFSIRILPLICYEIIYSGKIFSNNNFDLIVNISEDGWFGKSIGPKQHLNHSIFRAVESGKYLVRSSNNGIASIINPLGIIEQKVNFGQSGYIDLKEIKRIQPTIFSIYGNKIFGLLILLYILLIFSFNKIKNE